MRNAKYKRKIYSIMQSIRTIENVSILCPIHLLSTHVSHLRDY